MAKIIVADGRDVTDGAMYNLLSQVDCGVDILLISRHDGFVFNEEILTLKGKPYVIADVIEMGWDAKIDHTPFFGFDDSSFFSILRHPQFDNSKEQWLRLNDFIKGNQPIFYMKRELLAKDQDEMFIPLNYPAQYPIPEPQSKEDFLKRPLDIFYSWGLSHPERRKLHGRIWLGSEEHGYMVCDNLFWIELFMANENNAHKWLSVNIPHYCRFHSDQILNINALAKISISMPGAGTCCFRHTEASANAIMLMKDDKMAWSFPWLANDNCLKFERFGDEITTALNGLNSPQLYDIYLRGVENCKKYFLPNYINHIEQKIKKVL